MNINIRITLIVAMSHHQVIGYKGKMPWHLPAELAYFKRITLNKPVIMGRKTFESIGKALPQRHNIVVSTQAHFLAPNCEVCSSFTAALHSAEQYLIQKRNHHKNSLLNQPIATNSEEQEVIIIGGGQLFELALPLATRLYVTQINTTLPGDTFFPDFLEKEWIVKEEQSYPADEKNIYSFQTLVLDRIAGI